MRNNQPITQKEVSIPEHYILSTTTDLQGIVLTASEDFLAVSGYTRQEFIGQPHNVLRHPDVPAAVFKDMWETLRKGKTWSAIVKNRAKSGDHYWVLANVSTIEENGHVIGYVSVRTPATRQQIQAAELLYREIAQGNQVIQGGVVRPNYAAKWDFLGAHGPLGRSMLIYATLILLAGVIILTLGLYKTQVAPIEQRELVIEMKQLEKLITTQLEGKVLSVMDIAASLSGYEVMDAVLSGNLGREFAVERLSKVGDHFRRVTDYQSIRAQLHSLDRRSLVKSWLVDQHGESVTHPLLDQALAQSKVMGGLTLDVNGFGVGVTGFAPVFYQNQTVGAISVSGGVSSVTRELKKMGVDWVMLIDESAVKGSLPNSIRSNNLFKDAYRLAHNHWFDNEVVQQLQHQLTDLQKGEQRQVYLLNGQVVVDIPAYDQQGTVIGRHLLTKSAQTIEEEIQQATQQVIMLMIAVVAGVMLIVGVLVLVVQRRVIKPLAELSATMKNMMKTGRFNQRVILLDRGDEISDIVNAYNGFVGNVQRALTNVNDVMSSMAEGNLDMEITDPLQGDLAVMKKSVNATLARIRTTIRELSRVMAEMNQGNFSLVLQTDVPGEFKQIVDDTQHTLAGLKHTIHAIIHVMNKMENGKFQHRVTVEARGDLLHLKKGINASMDALENAIKDITHIVVAQSEGDLTQMVTAEYHGELRILKEAINTTTEKLIGVVAQAAQASSIVSGAAHEVSQGSLDLSQRVQQQVVAIEQTSAMMEKMNLAVQANSENSRLTAALTQEVQAKASLGERVMLKTIDAMNAIQQSSHKISDIVSLIDGIAFQTNLLALNAAVEAARAGRHGQGFAVVASEVRALAQKSTNAAKEIKDLINESVSRVNEGSQLAIESGEVLKAITDSISNVSDMIQQISHASIEQSQSIQQAHHAVELIDVTTQNNAALVDETSAAAERLSEQASVLQQDMAFFKTSQEG